MVYVLLLPTILKTWKVYCRYRILVILFQMLPRVITKKFCNLKTVSLRCNQCCTNARRAHWEKCWVLYTLVEIHVTISHRSCVSFCLHHLTSINVEIIQYEPGCISIEWETGSWASWTNWSYEVCKWGLLVEHLPVNFRPKTKTPKTHKILSKIWAETSCRSDLATRKKNHNFLLWPWNHTNFNIITFSHDHEITHKL